VNHSLKTDKCPNEPIGAGAIYSEGARAPSLSRVGARVAQGQSTCKCSVV